MNTVSRNVSIAQPDVTLTLDLAGIIQDAAVSSAISDARVAELIGRPWVETVGDPGTDKVRRMVEDARTTGFSGFRQVTQLFPSGLRLPVEYAALRIKGRAGLMVVGKSQQAVAELQARLIATQQAMERDHWRLRELETRFRLLFDASKEVILLVSSETLRIVESNPAALRALGVAQGQDFMGEVAPRDRQPLEALLDRVRREGKAPGMMVHLGADQQPWTLRASVMTAGPESVLLLQLAQAATTVARTRRADRPQLETLLERLPDGFVVIDGDGVIQSANQAFLDMVQVVAEGLVQGQRLSRWLAHPGADLAVLLDQLDQHHVVRLLATTIQGASGDETEVEISAAAVGRPNARVICVLLRDVTRRLEPARDQTGLRGMLESLIDQGGDTSLLKVVQDMVGIVERNYIAAALERVGGNRTAAAELLGLSRQSLYTKLARYDLDGLPRAASSRGAPDENGTNGFGRGHGRANGTVRGHGD